MSKRPSAEETQNGTYPTAEQIQAASQKALQRHEDVWVEEWSLRVPVCELSEREHGIYRTTIYKWRQRMKQSGTKGTPQFEADSEVALDRMVPLLCWLAMRNPHTGQKIFGTEDQVASLSRKGLRRVFEVASRLNPLGDEEEVVEAGKDSEATPSDAPPTSSAGS